MLRGHLYFEAQVAGIPAAAELEARLAADPGDSEALYQLALQNVVGQHYDQAIEFLLDLMRKDRAFGDDGARQTLLKVFELLGNDPRVNQYRRRMASLLY
jgi:putative thioredoxin